MKAILISDHAKWCALMMNGKKKVEVRKGTALYKATQKLIDKYGYAEFYVCCSKINRKHYHLIESINTDTGKTDYEIDYYIGSEDYLDWCFDGKVAFKFRCYKVEHFEREYLSRYFSDYYYDNGEPLSKKFYKKTCLAEKELFDYIGSGEGCAIHISDLEIFDKPKELSEFFKAGFDKELKESLKTEPYPICSERIGKQYQLTKAPQSWCYVEAEE